MVLMPRDENAKPIQVLGPKPGATANLSVISTTARVAFPSGAVVVQLTILENMWIKLGDVTVEAVTTDTLMLAGMHIIETNGHTYIAAIRASADSSLNITEYE